MNKVLSFPIIFELLASQLLTVHIGELDSIELDGSNVDEKLLKA